MALTVEKQYDDENEIWFVDLVGELDIKSKSTLKEELSELFNKKEADFELNCLKLEYIDSTGLGILISFYKDLSKYNRTLSFTNLKPNIGKVFTLTGLDKIFLIK